MTTEGRKVPLFHIDGTANIADLLTKPHEISMKDLSIGSTWQDDKSKKADFYARDVNANPKSYSQSMENHRTPGEIIVNQELLRLQTHDGTRNRRHVHA